MFKKSTQAPGVLKKGTAKRIIFFYPGEEGTYVENAEVTLYENGIVHIECAHEETTAHLQNCEIIWKFDAEDEDRPGKVRLLKPKAGLSDSDAPAQKGPSLDSRPQ